MFKGAKKAIVRAPHRFMGSKSIEDRIIIEWTKDFETANRAFELLAIEGKNFRKAWHETMTSQKEVALRLTELYEPIDREDAQDTYAIVQETPPSQLAAVAAYVEVTKSLEKILLPMVDETDSRLEKRCSEIREYLKAVSKALTKREHKKQDFDRFSNNVEKLLKKSDQTEKEQQQLAKAEQELDTAREIFHMQDQKVKSTIPYLLNVVSEFLNPLTAQLYLDQLEVYKTWRDTLHKFAQDQGLLVHEDGDYIEVIESWENRFLTVQPQCEQGLKTLKEGKTVNKPMRMDKGGLDKIEEIASKSVNKTNELAHKAVGKSTLGEKIQFSSPQGFFTTEVDLLASTESLSVSTSSPGGANSAGAKASPVEKTGSPLGYKYGGSFSSAAAAGAVVTSATVRSPVTGNFTGPPADTEQLRTRVRASMSSTARTLSPTPSATIIAGGGSSIMSDALSSTSGNVVDEEVSREDGDFISSKLRQQQQQQQQQQQLYQQQNYPKRIPPSSPEEYGHARYTFSGSEPGDVAFREGDRIHILDHGDETDDQWWFGQTADGRMGLFPSNYVIVD
ncbi:hypothetical protein DV113_001426 [Geotrichum candidum]|uniref:Similar to Saccharomyces cerevisiae YDR388W RVS167 Actin-associated protein with roles in endocytosis and exocytosis n=1 Tax=Geotrichum candidum TaxID=1173061 RepID=A0A0J9XIW9_GEOCN|nr:hypothetical protein DV113_001426 [Geotrichum candidum]KAI8134447.1 hypothetical protein DUD61_001910 [Geotrichum candidum]CDO57379.1 similar to Saccharomyces cerevisiae YDR388W RVS167 Actin-associated protein with roles in endocytosis and exocytosis [Geotrichum candidum]